MYLGPESEVVSRHGTATCFESLACATKASKNDILKVRRLVYRSQPTAGATERVHGAICQKRRKVGVSPGLSCVFVPVSI